MDPSQSLETDHTLRGFADIRHDCDQRDNMASYGFTQHDARSAAVEHIKDTDNNLDIKISWLKVAGQNLGGSWAYRVEGKPIDPSQLNSEPMRTERAIDELDGRADWVGQIGIAQVDLQGRLS